MEDSEGRSQLSPDGPRGHLMDLHAPTAFSPQALHASLPWVGTRLLLIAYLIGQARRVSEANQRAAKRLGFMLGHLD